jgi:glycosyltransferase involved in cell wall biosynthesis
MRKEMLSIILPTFNSERYIKDCLTSIFENVDGEFEILIIDSQSTDSTLNIIEDFKSPRLSVFSESDSGIYDALNKGIKRSKGAWLYFIGADDRLLPGFAELASQLENQNTIYYGDTDLFYEYDVLEGYSSSGKYDKIRLTKDCINHQAIIYPRKALEKNSYELKYTLHADYYLNLKLWGTSRFKKKYFPITIARYNMNGFSSTNADQLFKDNKAAIIKETLGYFYYFFYLWFRRQNWKSGFVDYY